MYSKLGLHKEFSMKYRFYNNPRFAFTGGGGEFIRGSPGYPIGKFLDKLSSQGKKIINHKEEFFNSSMRLCKRSISLLKKKKIYNNDFELSYGLYSLYHQNHFGKKALEGFIANYYFLHPLIDPDIRKIKYDINGKTTHDLIAYIYIRFAHDLIYFPFQGNRHLNPGSIQKAIKLNNKLKPYKIKNDYCRTFYLDKEKFSPSPKSKNITDAKEFLMKIFKSSKFIKIINKIYDNNVYYWAKEYSEKSDFVPLRHIYGLLSIAITKYFLDLNEKYMNKSNIEIDFNEEYSIINDIFK